MPEQNYLSIHSGSTIDSVVTRVMSSALNSLESAVNIAMTIPAPNELNNGKILVNVEDSYRAQTVPNVIASNMSSITLTGYTPPTTIADTIGMAPVSNTDTIPSAFRKVQGQILNITTHSIGDKSKVYAVNDSGVIDVVSFSEYVTSNRSAGLAYDAAAAVDAFTAVDSALDTINSAIEYNTDRIEDVEYCVEDSNFLTWESGALRYNNGIEVASSSVARSVYCFEPKIRYISMPSEWKIRAAVYSSTDASTFISSYNWVDGEKGFFINPLNDNGNYYRYCIQKKDESNLNNTKDLSDIRKYFKRTDSINQDSINSLVLRHISSLDEIAWGDLTYRDIFIKNDLLEGKGIFKNGVLDSDWSITAGNPELILENGKYILKCHSERSTCKIQYKTIPYFNRPEMFCAAQVKVLMSELTSSSEGCGLTNRFQSSGSLPRYKGMVKSSNNQYTVVGGKYGATNTSVLQDSDDYLVVGNHDVSDICIAYYKNIIWLNLTNIFGSDYIPTEAQMFVLYNNFVNYLERVSLDSIDNTVLNSNATMALLQLLNNLSITSEAQQLYSTFVSSLNT